MKCPECQSELVKGKTGYLCLHCGYAGASLAASKGKSQSVAPTVTPKVRMEPESIQPLTSIDHTEPAKHPAAPVVKIAAKPQSQADVGTHLLTEDLVARELGKVSDEEAMLSINEIVHTQPPSFHDDAPKTIDQLASKSPRHKRQPVRTATFIGVIVLILALLTVAYILPARAAANKLTSKLGTISSAHFSGSLNITGSSFLSVLNSNVKFDGTYSPKNANQLNYDGTFASRGYMGTFITDHSTLYSQMTGSDLPFIRYNQGIATYHITAGDWYSTKVDTSLYKYYCETKPDSKYPSPLIWYQAIRQVKLHPSPLIGYGVKVDGHSTTHLAGTISGKDLNNAWSNINSTLPPGCEWNNQLEDLSGLSVHYDAWTSPDYDQIQLHLADKDLGLKGTIVLKFDQYNAAPAVTAPTVTKNLADIFSSRAAIQARDFTRRANVDDLKKAIDAYAKANEATPPSALSKLVPKYFATVPKDPNGSDYKYAVTKKTYILSASLEDAGQLYSVTGP